MVMRLSSKMGLKTLFMKEGAAAEGIRGSLRKAIYPSRWACFQKRLWLAGFLAGHSNTVCLWQLQIYW